MDAKLRSTVSSYRIISLVVAIVIVTRVTPTEAMKIWAPPSERYPSKIEQRIDENGGTVNHPLATLFVPPGALSEPVNITLRIVKDHLYIPDLHKGEVLLSSVVSCEPHGLKFKRPVTLTIAHCAYITDEVWSYSVLINQEKGFPLWRDLTPDRGLVGEEIRESTVVLRINHLSHYSFVGDTKYIKIQIIAYSNSPGIDEYLETRIKCTKDFSRSQEETPKSSSHPVLIEKERQSSLFHKYRGNLVVNLTIHPLGWQPMGSVNEVIDSDLILWADEPSCKFVMKPTQDSGDNMYMEIEYFQEKSAESQRLKFTAYKARFNLMDYCQYLFVGNMNVCLALCCVLCAYGVRKYCYANELTDEQLLTLSLNITNEIQLRILAIIGLGIQNNMVDRSIRDKRNDITMAARDVLGHWRVSQKNDKQAYKNICSALKSVGMEYLIHIALQ